MASKIDRQCATGRESNYPFSHFLRVSLCCDFIPSAWSSMILDRLRPKRPRSIPKPWISTMMIYRMGSLFSTLPSFMHPAYRICLLFLREISCRSSSIKSASSLDSDASRPETRTIQRENGLEADSSASSSRSRRAARKNASPLSTKKAKKLLLPSSIKHLSDDENARSATVTKGRHVDGKSLPKSTPEISDEESLTDDE